MPYTKQKLSEVNQRSYRESLISLAKSGVSSSYSALDSLMTQLAYRFCHACHLQVTCPIIVVIILHGERNRLRTGVTYYIEAVYCMFEKI